MNSFKQQAAEYAVQFVESGMVVGLGTGSTADFALRKIADHLQSGKLKDIIGIPTSLATEQEALRLKIPLTTFEHHPVVDITIDGADEIAPNLDVIKGGGGALLREKIVAQASRRVVIVADESKLSPALGSLFAVPIEVIPFGWWSQVSFLERMGARWTLRQKDNRIFVTDQGNYILDCDFGVLSTPSDVAHQLDHLATVVEHGLFLGMVTEVVVAGEKGVRHMAAPHR